LRSFQNWGRKTSWKSNNTFSLLGGMADQSASISSVED
jgi:hypothetical protein